MEYTIENVPIEKIYRSTKGRNDKPFISSKGNPFTKVDIYIDKEAIDDPDFEGKLSYFEYYNNTDNWEEGTPISGTVSKNPKEDRVYFNLNLPTRKEQEDEKFQKINRRLRRLEEVVFPQGTQEPEKERSERVVEYPKRTGGKKPESPEVEGKDTFDDELPF